MYISTLARILLNFGTEFWEIHLLFQYITCNYRFICGDNNRSIFLISTARKRTIRKVVLHVDEHTYRRRSVVKKTKLIWLHLHMKNKYGSSNTLNLKNTFLVLFKIILIIKKKQIIKWKISSELNYVYIL